MAIYPKLSTYIYPQECTSLRYEALYNHLMGGENVDAESNIFLVTVMLFIFYFFHRVNAHITFCFEKKKKIKNA